MGAQHASINTFNAGVIPARERTVLWTVIEVAERVLAGGLLLALLPVLLLTAAMVALLSRRSPLIAHLRVGQAGRRIWVVKLRTMWSSAPPKFRFLERITDDALPEPKTRTDARITSGCGAWCRKYSIDECPQLWLVASGEMALVGPRPLTTHEIHAYYDSAAVELLSRKPGITGLWQIKGRSRLTYAQRRRLDLFLIRHWSLGLYIRVLMATIPGVLTGRDAW